MKKIQTVTLGVAAVASILWALQSEAQENIPMRNFMRQKLVYSQNVIEGISLECQDMVLTNAAKLMYMTRSNAWMELKSEDYLDQTRKFQNDVILLGNEARARSNPGMLKAYSKVIGGCIECHQAYRPVQAANILAAQTKVQEAVKIPSPDAIGTAKQKK